MRRVAKGTAEAILAVCALSLFLLLTPALLICELVCDEDDPRREL